MYPCHLATERSGSKGWLQVSRGKVGASYGNHVKKSSRSWSSCPPYVGKSLTNPTAYGWLYIPSKFSVEAPIIESRFFYHMDSHMVGCMSHQGSPIKSWNPSVHWLNPWTFHVFLASCQHLSWFCNQPAGSHDWLLQSRTVLVSCFRRNQKILWADSHPRKGDKVIMTGYEMGQKFHGGHAEYASVKARFFRGSERGCFQTGLQRRGLLVEKTGVIMFCGDRWCVVINVVQECIRL